MSWSDILGKEHKAIYYAAGRVDVPDAGFDDDFIYSEIATPIKQRKIPMKQILQDEVKVVFPEWKVKDHKVEY